ncbi:MAG TPA: hypothetical protein PK609_01180 [Candidatus Paceibacterota bacterium]|nr:hypothetical protein [Candidatus Paceibacterota bacterium]
MIVTRFRIKVNIPTWNRSTPITAAATTTAAPRPPTTGGGGHAGGHATPPEPLWKKVIGWSLAILALCVVIVVIVGMFRGWGFFQIPGAPYAERVAMAPQGTMPGAGPSGSATCPVVEDGWQDIVAPSNENGERSETLSVPDCHYIRFCDPARDPDCNATDFAGSRFTPYCAPPNEEERVFDQDRDRFSEFCSVQSNSAEDIPLRWRYERDPVY